VKRGRLWARYEAVKVRKGGREISLPITPVELKREQGGKNG